LIQKINKSDDNYSKKYVMGTPKKNGFDITNVLQKNSFI